MGVKARHLALFGTRLPGVDFDLYFRAAGAAAG
jgi:hypothetical protein